MTDYCKTCAAVDPRQLICLKSGRKISLESSYCEDHRRTPFERCEKCGILIGVPYILMDAAGNAHTFCPNCIQGAKV